MLNSENNKRIAKNTGMLYIRMLLTMAVTLYTSRIVLNTLGIEDYGIYNVVGGFVFMLGFLNNSMAIATQRFLSFEIGRNDRIQLSRVFSMSINIHFLIAIIILVMAETVGLWFLNTQLTIPTERMVSANWVYQFSILAFIVNVISVPYNATIIANERMNAFAWISIIEVSLKLLIVFLLIWFGYDKLKLYGFLVFIVSLIIGFIYNIYSRHNFPESKFNLLWDKSLFKKMINFVSWSLWGSGASVMYNQGVNILLNLFFGPAINAARGIAFQVQGAVNSFVYNFQIAMKPQIIKSYASDNLEYMHQLIFQGAKYSFFLLFTLSLPILLETEIVLKLWLNIVPEYTLIFTKLVIINVLIDSISGTLMTAAQASGKIKLYQGIVGGLLLLILPISYLFLKFGFSPQVTLYISISISIIALFVRLIILRNIIQIHVKDFLIKVVFNVIIVGLVTVVLPLTIHLIIIDQSFLRLILVGFTTIISSLGSIYLLGLNKDEKQYFLEIIMKISKKLSPASKNK